MKNPIEKIYYLVSLPMTKNIEEEIHVIAETMEPVEMHPPSWRGEPVKVYQTNLAEAKARDFLNELFWGNGSNSGLWWMAFTPNEKIHQGRSLADDVVEYINNAPPSVRLARATSDAILEAWYAQNLMTTNEREIFLAELKKRCGPLTAEIAVGLGTIDYTSIAIEIMKRFFPKELFVAYLEDEQEAVGDPTAISFFTRSKKFRIRVEFVDGVLPSIIPPSDSYSFDVSHMTR